MDVYKEITDKVIAALENAQRWQKPWQSVFTRENGTLALPVNVVTGAQYRGSNILSLWLAKRSSPVWGTYKQWQSIGAQVRAGERSTLCVFWKAIEYKNKSADAGDDDETETRLIARPFHLFNAEQVDDWSGAPQSVTTTTEPTPAFDPIAQAEAFFAATGAAVKHGGDRACYTMALDLIRMPERSAFVGSKTSSPAEAYYSTLAHETTHWTGHATRCNRQLANRFGSESYAAEELIAELGAAFLCARLAVSNEPRPDHAQYIAGWLKVLRNDRKAIFAATSKAQQAVQFLEGLQLAKPEQIAEAA